MQLDIFNVVAVSSSFLLILLAEMGDKTQLMTVSLAARYRSPAQVFMGVFLAEASVSMIGIAVGTTAASLIPVDLVSRVAGGVFIIFGLLSLRSRSKEEAVDGGWKGGAKMILMIFAMVAAAEMGDKTQLATIATAVEHNSPLSVALGVAAAFAVTSLTAVILGRGMSRRLPIGLIQKAAAIIFLAVGAALLLDMF